MNDSLKDQLAALKHLIITEKETEMACGDKRRISLVLSRRREVEMGILTVEVKVTDLDIVKEMIEELKWLRFFYKEAGYHFIESPLSVYATIRDKYEQEPKQAREEDLNGMC